MTLKITCTELKGQQDFQKIEELIKKEVEKLPNPEDIGEGPAYKPGSSRSGGGDRRPFQKKRPFNKNKSGGNNSNGEKKKFYPKRPPTQTGGA